MYKGYPSHRKSSLGFVQPFGIYFRVTKLRPVFALCRTFLWNTSTNGQRRFGGFIEHKN